MKTNGSHYKSFSANDYFEKAQDFVNTYNYEMAIKFVDRALKIDSDNTEALTLGSTILMEMGNMQKAREYLERCIRIEPDHGYTKYLSLAQMLSGVESLNIYTQGIAILEQQIRNLNSSLEQSDTKEEKRDLSNAYCSVAELYLTDLCDEDDAESRCLHNIEAAIGCDSTNPEALQTKARFYLIKEDFETARSCMISSLDIWLPDHLALLDNRVVDPSMASSSAVDPVISCPLLYTTRIETSKLLIEIELWDLASKVLDGLIEEDRDVVDVWYLHGWLNYLRGTIEKADCDEGFLGNANFYLKEALKTHSKSPTNDIDMIHHIEELLEELKSNEEISEEFIAKGNIEEPESSSESCDNKMEE